MHNQAYYYCQYIIFFILLISFSACRSEQDKKTENEEQATEIDTSTLLLKYNNNLFTVPSPFQATYTIRKHDIEFDEELLNPVKHAGEYSTSFKKALNIGVYGTDLGYLHVHNQRKETTAYFKVIHELSRDLRIIDALSTREIHEIENQLEEQDSLIYLLADVYRNFDSYLRENNRHKIGALIITGGWIESNYMLSRILQDTKNRSLINRLGEQKKILDNLIELLSSYYYESQDYTNLIDALVDLAYEFDGIIYNYYYEEPIVKENEKLTIIRSRSNVVISKYHLNSIAEKLAQIRNNIIV